MDKSHRHSQAPGASGSRAHLAQDVVSSTRSTFDALEALGPSLSQVLTFVNPPQPRQAAGEATNGASLEHSATSLSTKFDVRLSRSVVLGKLADPTVDNARKTQESFAKLLSKIQCEATGLVLLHDATIVVFLETTAEQFVTVLKQLELQRLIDPKSIKILANCDDHGVRILQGLYFKKIVLNRSDAGEWTDDTAPQCIVDTFLNLIKFVKKIGPMPPGEIRKCLTNLSNTDQTFLPSSDLVLWLLSREELMTLEEYLDFFDKPIAVELASERVWPLHPLIQ